MNPSTNSKTRNLFEKGLLRYLTEEQLNTIQSKKIGIGGVGGLGSNVAMILVRSGFMNLEMLDQDVIEASNLNRQQYYYDEIGRVKVDTTKQRLLEINPDLNITAHRIQWNESNGDQFFTGCDFIIEAFDQADFKFRFVEFYQDKADYVISGNGMAGLMEKKPMVIKKLKNIYIVGDGSTDSACGHPPMAPRVTACAAGMAEIVLDLTLNIKSA
ncbi:MAG: sulfur carrier protein ThiS adenylyltransferase ThiF [Candidatus Omnitrophica bacterium]|nr:sulfur carrier protein ThiS adenylyltransferase ThiF [Candidatus Omnitrophota bacterium]